MFYLGSEVVGAAALNFIEDAKTKGVEHINFVLSRSELFDPRGRFETLEQAKKIDEVIITYLTQNNIPFTLINSINRERVQEILQYLV
jgi:hypothetical protein